MINTKDQEELFKLIAEYLEKDIECFAIGGTAMMFASYKNTTKDIDLVFKTIEDRNVFIKAIEKLGYSNKAIGNIYDNKRKELFSKPLIYSRGEERFDLFVDSVFGFKLDFLTFVQKHEFIGKQELILFVPIFELLILLKSITRREKDFEDIVTIIKTEKIIDWSFIVKNAIKQKNNLPWILIDLEDTMQKLRSITLIKQKYFDELYSAQN
jgi:hypothetical protein